MRSPPDSVGPNIDGFRALAPAWAFGAISRLKKILARWMDHLAMFARIKLAKSDGPCP